MVDHCELPTILILQGLNKERVHKPFVFYPHDFEVDNLITFTKRPQTCSFQFASGLVEMYFQQRGPCGKD